MTLQNIFYFFGTVFFIFFIGLIVYIAILLTKLKRSIEIASVKAKATANNLAMAKYTIKAGILKTFLSFLGHKGGENDE